LPLSVTAGTGAACGGVGAGVTGTIGETGVLGGATGPVLGPGPVLFKLKLMLAADGPAVSVPSLTLTS
jgi:hypothetical protein